MPLFSSGPGAPVALPRSTAEAGWVCLSLPTLPAASPLPPARLLQKENLPAEGTADRIIAPSLLNTHQKPVLPGKEMFQTPLLLLLTNLLLVGLVVESFLSKGTAKEIHSNKKPVENSVLLLKKKKILILQITIAIFLLPSSEGEKV